MDWNFLLAFAATFVGGYFIGRSLPVVRRVGTARPKNPAERCIGEVRQAIAVIKAEVRGIRRHFGRRAASASGCLCFRDHVRRDCRCGQYSR